MHPNLSTSVVLKMTRNFQTDEDALEAVRRRGRALEDVPVDFRSPELCRDAVCQAGSALEFVPSIWKDEGMCLTAVKLNGYALMFVPVHLRTMAVCEAALENDKDATKYVPDDVKYAMEGYLLTVHCDTTSWQIEVTYIGGRSLVTVQTYHQETWSNLLAPLRTVL